MRLSEKQHQEFSKYIKTELRNKVVILQPNPDKIPCQNGKPKATFYRCVCCKVGGLKGLSRSSLYTHLQVASHKLNRDEFLGMKHDAGRAPDEPPRENVDLRIALNDRDKIIENLKKDNDDKQEKLNISEDARNNLLTRITQLEQEKQTPNCELEEKHAKLQGLYSELEEKHDVLEKEFVNCYLRLKRDL